MTIVSLQDSEAANAFSARAKLLLLGDFIALLGAAFYGCYTTLLKLQIQHESRVDMTLFLGFVGLYCLVFFWPFNVVLSVLGIEPLELPPTRAVTFCVIVSSSFEWSLIPGEHDNHVCFRLPLGSRNVDDVTVDCDDGFEFEYTSCVNWRFYLQR